MLPAMAEASGGHLRHHVTAYEEGQLKYLRGRYQVQDIQLRSLTATLTLNRTTRVDQPRITADRQSRRKDKDGRIDVAAATQHHQSRTMFTSAEDALLALGAEGRLTVTDVSTQPNEIGFARSGPLPLEVTAESGQVAALISRLPADLASSLREGLQRYVDAAPSREDTQPRISVQNAANGRPVERVQKIIWHDCY